MLRELFAGLLRVAAAVLVALACLFGAAGCASTGDSEMPWNQPQPWEGAPNIPGFGNGGR